MEFKNREDFNEFVLELNLPILFPQGDSRFHWVGTKVKVMNNWELESKLTNYEGHDWSTNIKRDTIYLCQNSDYDWYFFYLPVKKDVYWFLPYDTVRYGGANSAHSKTSFSWMINIYEYSVSSIYSFNFPKGVI
jgi:hypothetical protein